jgi:hypothetical protein
MAAPTRIRWSSLTTIASAAILVGTELLGAAWASGWALAGFFELGPTMEVVFQVSFGLLALVAIAAFVRSAVRVEPVTEAG